MGAETTATDPRGDEGTVSGILRDLSNFGKRNAASVFPRSLIPLDPAVYRDYHWE